MNGYILNTGTITLADDVVFNNTGTSTNTNGAIQIIGTVGGTGSIVLSNVSTALTQTSSIRFETGVNTFLGSVLVAKGTTTYHNSASFGNAANVITLGASGQGSAALLATASAVVEAHAIIVASGSGGTLTLGSTTTGSPSFTNQITLNDDLNVISASTSSGGMLLSGKITGTNGLNIAATGRVRITNTTSDFAGGVSLMSGTLIIGSDTDTADPLTYTKGPLGKGTLTLNGGAITANQTATNTTLANPVIVNASTISNYSALTNNKSLTLTGPMTGTGTLRVGFVGTATGAPLFIQGDLSNFQGTFDHTSTYGSSPNLQFVGTTPTLVIDASKAKLVLNQVASGNRAVRIGSAPVGGVASVDATFKIGELSGITAPANIFIDASGASVVEVGALGTDSSYAGYIRGNGTSGTVLRKMGSGSFTMLNTTSNAFTGGVIVSAGSMIAGGLASPTIGVFGMPGPLPILLNDAGTLSSNVSLLVGGAFEISIPITVQNFGTGTTSLGGNTDSTSTFSADISLAKDLTLTSVAIGANSVVISSVISSTGVFGITKVGLGNVTLTNTNTYSGTTLIAAGTLIVGSGGASGTLGSGAVTNNSILQFNRTGALSVPGAIDGTGSVQQLGSSTTTFTAASSYTGTTDVSQGTLVLDHSGSNLGALGNTAVTVSSGGTLLVKGTTAINSGGSLTLNGILDLRDSTVNTLAVSGNFTVNSGIIHFNIGTANGSNDQVSVGGTVSQTGTTTVNLSTVGSLASGLTTYTLIAAPGGGLTGGGAGFMLGTTPSGFNTFNLANSTTTALILTVTANATPATAYWTGLASFTGAPTDPSNNWGYGSSLLPPKSNWSTTLAGTTDALQVPGSITNVIFTASNASGTALVTQLDGAYDIASLSFNTSTAAAITSVEINTNSFNLTLRTGGLTVDTANTSTTTLSGTGAVLVGTSQSWANNSATQSLTVSAVISVGSGTKTLTLNGTGVGGVTLSGVVSDGGGQLVLVFNQAGTTLLSNSNTFTGGVTINSGTLALGAGALNSTTPNAVAFGPGSTGVLQLNGTNLTVPSLTTDVTVGTPIVENGAATDATLTLNIASGANTFAGVLRDNGNPLAITKQGAGTLVLTGINTYTGLTTVSAGVFRANHGVGLSATSLLSITGGVWESSVNITRAEGVAGGDVQVSIGTSGFSARGGAITVNLGGSGADVNWGNTTFNPTTLVLNETTADSTLDFQNGINLGTTTRTIAVNSASNVATISGVIQNIGGLTKTGVGRLILTNVNIYTGNTSVNAGILQLNNAFAIGSSTLTTANIEFDQSVVGNAFTFGGLSGSNGLALLNNAGSPSPIALSIGNNSNNTTYSGVLSGTSSSVIKIGTGTLTLSGQSTFTGGLTINTGVVTIGANSTPISGTVTSGPVGTGTMTFFGGALTANTAATIGNAINVTGTTNVYSPASTTFTLNGNITGNGTVKVDPTGISGQTGAVNFGGSTSAFTGTFDLTFPESVGPAFSAAGVTVVFATPDASQAKFVLHGAINFSSNGRGLRAGDPTTPLKMGSLSGDGGLLLAAGGGFDSYVYEIGYLNTDTIYSGGIRDNGTVAITKVGSGKLTLGSGRNNFSGSTTVRGGTLAVTKDAASTTLNNGTNDNNGVTAATSDIFTYLGTIFVPLANDAKVSFGFSGNLGPNISPSAEFFVINATATTFQVSTTLGGVTPVDITAVGSSVRVYPSNVSLGATDTPVQLGDSGSDTTPIALIAAGPVTIGRNINVNAFGSGTTSIGGNTNDTSTFSGTISLAKDLTVTSVAVSGSNTVLISGVISSTGNFGLTKVGAGRVTLSNDNTYAGPTFVNAGTLIVSNTTGSATSSGSVTVQTTGRLQGGDTAATMGLIAGPVTVALTGTIAPGNAIGTITVGAASISGTYEFEISDAVTSAVKNTGGSTDTALHDQIKVTGSMFELLSGSTFKLIETTGMASFNAANPYSWTIGTTVGGSPTVTGVTINTDLAPVLAAAVAGSGGTFELSLTINNNFVNLNYAAVPEPGLLLLLSGMVAIGVRARRRAA